MSIAEGEISARVRKVVAHLGLPLRQLAVAIGVSAPFLSQVQTGRHPPSLAMLVGLRQVYGISIDWVLVGVGGMLCEAAPAADERLAEAVHAAAGRMGRDRLVAMLELLAGDQAAGARTA